MEKGNEKENKVKEKGLLSKKPLHDPRIRKTLLYRERKAFEGGINLLKTKLQV